MVADLPAKFRTAAAISLMLFVAGCTTFGADVRNPVPAQDAEAAMMTGSTPVRFWGDEASGAAGYKQPVLKTGAILSLSGGGINGAYGAGYMLGWTAHGDRPKFDIVTGISVGALIAPMAFLGPRYDSRLQSVFATLAAANTGSPAVLAALFGAPGVIDNAPVRIAINQLVDEPALDEIGREARTGRLLLIGTTNLDAERPVIWDIGAIANSNIPNKLDLVHQIMLASAAVPGVYPPVLIHVALDGKVYDELHVDGGVTQQVVLPPRGINIGGRVKGTLYVIYNGTIAPTRNAVQQVSTLSVLARAVPTMLKYGGRGDLTILETKARSLGMGYRLTDVPATFPAPPSALGDPAWLNSLFQYGYKSGLAGTWQSGT